MLYNLGSLWLFFKAFYAPVAAPTILFIVTLPLVKFPVQVGVGVFSSLIVTEAVAGATIVKKDLILPTASPVWNGFNCFNTCTAEWGHKPQICISRENPFEIA